MKSFFDRTLNKISTTINFWIIKPSIGNSGGILVGANESLFHIINQWVLNFSVTVCLQNKNDDFI
jgi:hypothetical protein